MGRTNNSNPLRRYADLVQGRRTYRYSPNYMQFTIRKEKIQLSDPHWARAARTRNLITLGSKAAMLLAHRTRMDFGEMHFRAQRHHERGKSLTLAVTYPLYPCTYV